MVWGFTIVKQGRFVMWYGMVWYGMSCLIHLVRGYMDSER